MHRFLTIIRIAGLLVAQSAPAIAGESATLELVLQHRTAPLADSTGAALQLTRLDYLLSNVRLQRADGPLLGLPKWVAYVHYADATTGARLDLRGLPAGRYTRLMFDIGLDEAMDKTDPASLPPDHPLNPSVNGLHWGWRGGYVFLAVEGRKGDEGFSHHLAGAAQRMTVSLPVDLDLSSDTAVRLLFDVTRVFAIPHPIALQGANVSTHSRGDDGLARRIADNVEQAWSVLGIEPVMHGPDPPSPAVKAASAKPTRGTPYLLIAPAKFSRPLLPADNPLTVEGVELGRRLFHEARLSGTNTQSCASCHDSACAFTDHGRRFSTGADGGEGSRNAMGLINLAWKSQFFWDGRASSLREQAVMPIQESNEMHETLDHACSKLADDPVYSRAFEHVFGSPQVTGERIGLALEQYLLTLVSCDSKFDRAMRGEGQLTEDEKQGFALFFTESEPARGIHGADCFHCHGGADFTSHQFANNGLDDDSSRRDQGRARVTKNPADRGKFIVPTLRNIALTAPYMHDGRFATLDEVVDHYSTGVKRSATLDPNLAKHPGSGVPLTEADKKALIAFLKTLTDERFAK